MKAVKQFNPIQRGYIERHDLGNLLRMPEHLMIPLHLLQWLVFHTSSLEGSPDEMFFRKRDKRIDFRKGMVDRVFGFNHGNIPFTLESDDPEIVREVEELCSQCRTVKNIPVSKLESILLGAQDEVVFMRSFVLFFPTTVLCPQTYNFVNPKYMFSLRDRDIPHIGRLDFGTLCLEHLWNEMENWTNKLFMNPGDLNRLCWIGGCIPVLGIVYMDFLDFNGIIGPIDYSLPRIAHITNADFLHVQRFDLRVEKRKYGRVPLKDISLTPYWDPLAIVPLVAVVHQPDEVLEEDVAIDAADLLAEDIEDHGSDVDESDNEDEFEGDDYYVEEEDFYVSPESFGDIDDPISYPSPDSVDGIADLDGITDTANNEATHGKSVQGEDLNLVGEGLLNIVSSYGDLSATPSVGIAEGFVPSDLHYSQGLLHGIDVGLSIAMSYSMPVEVGVAGNFLSKSLLGSASIEVTSPDSKNMSLSHTANGVDAGHANVEPPSLHEVGVAGNFLSETLPGSASIEVISSDSKNMSLSHTANGVEAGHANVEPPSLHELESSVKTGPSTRDKRNRKKRAAKEYSPDPFLSKKMKMHPDVEAFYRKYLRKEYFKVEEIDPSPLFIDLGAHNVTYDVFHSSFKARGHIGVDVMAAPVELINIESSESRSSKSSCSKYVFSPSLSKELCKDSALFDKVSCVREVKRITSEVNLAEVDLLHFPLEKNEHWALLCLNSLFCTTNFFDSAGRTNENTEENLVQNIVLNLTDVFLEINIDFKDLTQFKKSNLSSYPCQSNYHDSGLYSMLYMENFNGKFMKDFSHVVMLKYRMLMAHKLFYSPKNRASFGKMEALKDG